MSDASPLMDQITLESFFYPIFALRDNVNLWGAPWEAQRRYDYTVLRKGGGLAGFSSFISFIPELKFGISILMNSDTGAAEDITFDMWTQIIPFLESVLPSLSIAAPSPYVKSSHNLNCVIFTDITLNFQLFPCLVTSCLLWLEFGAAPTA